MRFVRKIIEWVSNLDVTARLAAVLCLAPFGIMLFGNPHAGGFGDYSVPLWETVVSLLILPVSIIVLLPVVAAPQFANFWLVRRSVHLTSKLLLLIVSAAALVPYFNFVRTADLTSTSTAALAAAFYPIYLAMFTVPISIAIWGISPLVERHSHLDP